VTVPDPTAPAAPLLDGKAWAVIYDAARQYTTLSQLAADVADTARDGLEPLVAVLVAEQRKAEREDCAGRVLDALWVDSSFSPRAQAAKVIRNRHEPGCSGPRVTDDGVECDCGVSDRPLTRGAS
jgi:hypothetical protein